MRYYIDGIDFYNMENQRYWSFPKNYKKDSKLETKEMILSGNYLGARKYDGAFYKFLKDEDGNSFLFSRSRGVSGEFAEKFEWVPHLHEFFNSIPNGTCLLGELYFPEKEGSRHVTTIMGCLKEKAIERQNKGEYLNFYVFDVLAYDGTSYVNETIEFRVAALNAMKITYTPEYVRFANYLEGEALWYTLHEIFAAGGEGIVITKKGTTYQPGKRTARQTLKVKKELGQTIDCFFTGNCSAPIKEYTGKYIEDWTYWLDENDNKIQGKLYEDYQNGRKIIPITRSFFYDIPGSLEIGVVSSDHGNFEFSKFDIIPIGFLSGLAEEIKVNYKDYAGKVIEVTAMEIEKDSKALRHAKMIQFRPDKNWNECTWESIFE